MEAETAIVLVPAAAGAAKSLQSCPTLCTSLDGSPPGSPDVQFSRSVVSNSL